MELSKTLKQIGLTEKEATLYMGALTLGRFSIVEIARKTGLKRPTCYVIIEELIAKGLLSAVPGPKKTLYAAEHPDALLRSARHSYHLAEEVMPQLQVLMKSATDKPILKVYVGQAGLQNIFEDILRSCPEKKLYYIASIEDMIKAVGENFMKDWVQRRFVKDIRTYSVRMKHKETNVKSFNETGEMLREIYYAPSSFYIPYTVFIYGKRVAFLSTEKELFGFIVESADFAKTMKAFFDVMVSISTKQE